MRLFRHLFAPSARRLFPETTLQRIAVAVARDELRHRGEIRFAVESRLDIAALRRGVGARDRALEAFARLRVWDTRENNGVLIYLLLADRRIEIVADRGFDGRVSPEQWRGVCLLMEERMAAGEVEAAALAGVSAAGDLAREHFPMHAPDTDRDQLPDAPVLLD